MANDASRAFWTGLVPMVLVGLIGFGAAAAVADGDNGVVVGPPPARADSVMGPLELGVNRQGMDFSANEVHAANAALCAEMCRTNSACKAMTYVKSLKTCWLKRAVPPPASTNGPDYVSSVKVYVR